MKKDNYKTYIELNTDVLSFIGYMVDNYGKVVALEPNYPKSEEIARKHHDYVYFCITKAARSLIAANEIAKIGFREDVMTLVRTVYETYLLLGNAIMDKKFIIKAITISLGLRENYFVHPKTKSGKKDYSKVKLKGSEKEIDYNMSKPFLARNTFCNIDGKLHSEFYKYMSEHSHSDFIGSGNYRACNNTKYDVEVDALYLDTVYVIMYMSFLIIQSIRKYHRDYDELYLDSLYIKEILEISVLEKTLKDKLILVLSELDFTGGNNHFKELFIERLNYDLS